MKKIEGIIRPHLLDPVRTALQSVGVEGMTVTEVKGCGHGDGVLETYRGSEYRLGFTPKVKIELALAEDLLEPAMNALLNAARTWRVGDGKVLVTSLEEVVRIRTGELNEQAL